MMHLVQTRYNGSGSDTVDCVSEEITEEVHDCITPG